VSCLVTQPISAVGPVALCEVRQALSDRLTQLSSVFSDHRLQRLAVQAQLRHQQLQTTKRCSGATLDLVKSLGADAVVDYTREDFSRAGRVCDTVFDTVGKSGFSRSLESLKRGGFYVRVGGSGRLSSILGGIVQEKWASITGAAKVIGGVARGTAEDLSFLKGLIEAGNYGQ
jgi:NADPH:quinone reductase-like Zn-dependent oxidoreductase